MSLYISYRIVSYTCRVISTSQHHVFLCCSFSSMLELQSRLAEKDPYDFSCFKVLQAHVLPLTNCAFNKSGAKVSYGICIMLLLCHAINLIHHLSAHITSRHAMSRCCTLAWQLSASALTIIAAYQLSLFAYSY